MVLSLACTFYTFKREILLWIWLSFISCSVYAVCLWYCETLRGSLPLHFIWLVRLLVPFIYRLIFQNIKSCGDWWCLSFYLNNLQLFHHAMKLSNLRTSLSLSRNTHAHGLNAKKKSFNTVHFFVVIIHYHVHVISIAHWSGQHELCLITEKKINCLSKLTLHVIFLPRIHSYSMFDFLVTTPIWFYVESSTVPNYHYEILSRSVLNFFPMFCTHFHDRHLLR